MIPNEWIKSDNPEIKIENMPTHFGKISFEVKFKTSQVTLTMESDFHTKPKHIQISLPQIVKKAQVNNRTIQPNSNNVILPNKFSKVVFFYNHEKTESKTSK